MDAEPFHGDSDDGPSPADGHPCDGTWRPLDAWLTSPSLSDPQVALACPAGFTGFTVQATQITEHPSAWEQLHDAVLATGSGLRIDVSRDPSQRLLAAVAGHEPDLIRVPVSTQGSLAQVERWAQEAATAIVLFIPTDAPSPATILETAAALPSVVGVSLEALDEELTPVLSAPEDYAVFSPGLEFASAYRVGATAFEGEFGLLGPAACAEAIELARTDLPQALQLERTLQRLIEGTFERVTRGLVPARRAALLAATFAFFEEEGGAPPSEIAPDLWTEWRLAIHGAGLFPADSD